MKEIAGVQSQKGSMIKQGPIVGQNGNGTLVNDFSGSNDRDAE